MARTVAPQQRVLQRHSRKKHVVICRAAAHCDPFRTQSSVAARRGQVQELQALTRSVCRLASRLMTDGTVTSQESLGLLLR